MSLKNFVFTAVTIFGSMNLMLVVAESSIEKSTLSIPTMELKEVPNLFGGIKYSCEFSESNPGNWNEGRLCEGALAKAFHAVNKDHVFDLCVTPEENVWVCPRRAR